MSNIPRKSYSVHFKLAVIDYVNNTNRSQASSRFHINPSMISRWIKRHNQLADNKNSRHIGNSGRPISHPIQEEQLHTWIKNERDQLYPVTFADIKSKMLQITNAEHDSTFKASSGWLYGFVKRYHLSLRQITKFVKKGTNINTNNDDIATSNLVSASFSPNKRPFINLDVLSIWTRLLFG